MPKDHKHSHSKKVAVAGKKSAAKVLNEKKSVKLAKSKQLKEKKAERIAARKAKLEKQKALKAAKKAAREEKPPGDIPVKDWKLEN
jgi:hypothetical protein